MSTLLVTTTTLDVTMSMRTTTTTMCTLPLAPADESKDDSDAEHNGCTFFYLWRLDDDSVSDGMPQQTQEPDVKALLDVPLFRMFTVPDHIRTRPDHHDVLEMSTRRTTRRRRTSMSRRWRRTKRSSL